MKKTISFLLLFSVLLFAMSAYGCKKPQHKFADADIVATDEAFTVAVGSDKYTIANEVIEEEAPVLRGPGDVTAAVNYLNAVADGTAGVLRVADAIKGQKLTTFQIWINLVPVLIQEIKTLVTAGKKLKKFNELYAAAQGLTIPERAAVATAFAQKFNIPQAEAEELTELIIESAVVNMKVAGKIQTLTKKGK